MATRRQVYLTFGAFYYSAVNIYQDKTFEVCVVVTMT